MTSPYARPDRTPLEELERLLAALEDELTGRVRGKVEPEPHGKSRPVDLHQARQRIALLEGENQLLRQRISAAREGVERLRTRMRFIEDRVGSAPAGGGDSA